MSLLELVEKWASDKGWYASYFKSIVEGKEDGYIYLSRKPSFSRRPGFVILWADGSWDMDGRYPEDPTQKLQPADPDFFLNLEYIIITRT